MSTKRPPAHLDPQQRDVVWSALCAIIYEQLAVGRSIRVPGLGCFCFDVKEEFMGTGGWKTTRTPVLVFSKQFLMNHGLARESAKDEVGARVGGAQPIFWEGVSARSGVFWESRYTGRATVSKDIARECVATTLRIFGAKAGLSDSAILSMGRLGSLRSVKQRIRFHFSTKDSLFGRRHPQPPPAQPPRVFEAAPPVEADLLVLDLGDERNETHSEIRSQEVVTAPPAPSPRLDVERRGAAVREEAVQPGLHAESVAAVAESTPSLTSATEAVPPSVAEAEGGEAERGKGVQEEGAPEVVPLASLQDAAPQQLEQLTSRQHGLAQQRRQEELRKQERFRYGRLQGRQEGGTISATFSARSQESTISSTISHLRLPAAAGRPISAREREPAPPHRSLREAIAHRPAPELKVAAHEASHTPAPELGLREAISAQNRLVTPPEPPPAPPPPPPPASAEELANKAVRQEEWALQKGGGVAQRVGSAQQRAARRAMDAHNALLAQQRKEARKKEVPRAEPMGQLIGSEAGVAAEQARLRAKALAMREEAREDCERREAAATVERAKSRAAEAAEAAASEAARLEAERSALERKRAALLAHKAAVEETLREQAERKRLAHDDGAEAARSQEQAKAKAEAEEAAQHEAKRERERRCFTEQLEASRAKEERVLRERKAVLDEGQRVMLADITDREQDAARAAAARHALRRAEQKLMAEQEQARKPLLQQAREAPRLEVPPPHAASPCLLPMPAPRAPRLLSASRRSADLALLRRRVERSWAAGEGPDQEVSHARRHARRRPLGSRQRRLAMFRALQHLHKAPAFRINRTRATPRRMRAWSRGL